MLKWKIWGFLFLIDAVKWVNLFIRNAFKLAQPYVNFVFHNTLILAGVKPSKEQFPHASKHDVNQVCFNTLLLNKANA